MVQACVWLKREECFRVTAARFWSGRGCANEQMANVDVMKKRLVLVLSLSAVLLAGGGGCALFVVGAAAGAGAAGYAYVKGELKATEQASLDRTWAASLGAMKDLEFPITKQSKDALTGHLTARNASDKKIEIDLKKISDKATEITIRVGTFGDENLSRVILEKIRKRL